MRQRILLGGQLAVLSVVILTIVWYRDFLQETFKPIRELFPVPGTLWAGPFPGQNSTEEFTPSGTQETELDFDSLAPFQPIGTPIPVESVGSKEGSSSTASSDKAGVTSTVLGEERLGDFVQAIFDPADTIFQRLECPMPTDLARYNTLKPSAETTSSDSIKFFFALDLTQCVDLLPRLIGSVVETIRFLGPENCVLSIVEGNSDDGTAEVLEAITAEIEGLGTEYYFQTSNIDPKAKTSSEGETGGRIVSLAQLRNMALQPMLDDKRRYKSNATVIFLNDVAICMEDILELVYQRTFLGADMTCAMDWTYLGTHPTFYDVWISRTMSGESFFRIPEDKSWDFAWNLFWNDPDTGSRYSSHLPFQVFSCWNGAVAFTAEPIINNQVAFRSNNRGECFQGEPELLCKDFWFNDYGKIAVVPSVNLEYTDERGKDIKALKGYTSKWVGSKSDERSSINWNPNPPDQVKCMEVLEMSEWRAWNETLV